MYNLNILILHNVTNYVSKLLTALMQIKMKWCNAIIFYIFLEELKLKPAGHHADALLKLGGIVF